MLIWVAKKVYKNTGFKFKVKLSKRTESKQTASKKNVKTLF